MDYLERLQQLRTLMAEKGWDAVVLTGSDPHAGEYPAPRWKQVQWLTGFAGEAGDIVVTRDHAGLWTDSRYFIQAARVLPQAGFQLHKTRLPESVPIPAWLAKVAFPPADRPRPVVIAVDGRSHSAEAVLAIRNAFSEAGTEMRLVSVPDLLDVCWTDRPAVPQAPVITLGDDLTGSSRREKIAWLRAWLQKRGYDAMLLSALDEIAWLLNVRGSDIAYNPLVLSYLFVGRESVDWYVRKDAAPDSETRDSLAELREDGVQILRYDAIDYNLGEDASMRVYADPATLNYEVYTALRDSYPDAVFGPSPVPLRKAVKNAVELDGMREAHFVDGLVMERFLYWLESLVEAGEPISEWDAAVKLGELRAAVEGYRGDSFETISAYGAGAALPHYVTPQDGSAPLLAPSGLYLCDSGGQYLFGTTDITRTVPLGPCTALEREDYTLVLKGHIALATAIFPRGTSGCHLDVLARLPLWTSKRNFGHGTGHGIGHYLCVHEGPQAIRQNTLDCPLQPGMLVTDEPGLYREGQHGVRHENVLQVVDAGENDFGHWYAFEPLTLCHFDTSPLVRELLSPAEIDWLNAYNASVYEKLSPHLPGAIAAWLRGKTQAI